MTDAIGRFLHVLRSAGARIRSERMSAIIRGPVPDEEELETLVGMSTPAPTPPDEWIPGHPVHLITTNTPKPAEIPKEERKLVWAEKDELAALKSRKARLERQVARLEKKHHEKK